MPRILVLIDELGAKTLAALRLEDLNKHISLIRVFLIYNINV